MGPVALSMTKGGSEGWVQVGKPSALMTSATEAATSPELVREIADARSNEMLPSPVDGAIAHTAVNGSAENGGTTELDNEDDTEVEMAGEIPVVAVLDAPFAAPVSGEVVEDSTSPLSTGTTPLVHGLSSSASMADVMSGNEPVEAMEAPVDALEQVGGDELPVTLDVQAAVAQVVPEGETEPEQFVSTSEALVAEEGAGVSAAAGDEQCGIGTATSLSIELADVEVNQTAEALASDDMAPAEVDSTSPAGVGMAVPSASAGGVESVATQLPSLAVDEVPDVDATVWDVQDQAVNTMNMVRAKRRRCNVTAT